MQKFELPHEVMQSYLVLPKFLSDHFASASGTSFSHSMPDTLDSLEIDINPKLNPKSVFFEIALNEMLNTEHEIVKKLIGCKIPFHISNVYTEDYEVHFWRYMCKDSIDGLCGFTTMDKPKTRQSFKPDLKSINEHLTLVEAQLKLLNGDVSHLLEVRNIYVE